MGRRARQRTHEGQRSSSETLTITPLGGVGRFGGNAMLFDTGTSAVLVDCGVRFLDDDEAPGFDFGLCDLDALDAVKDRLDGYLLTHGHEDHVGALAYAYERVPAPIYCTPFTRFRARKAFERAGAALPDDHVLEWEPGFVGRVGEIDVEAFAVSHSIPGALALALSTEAGTIVHSGDFRVDRDPLVGPPTDLEGLDERGQRGVDLLVADSTSVAVEGDNAGERSVVEPLTKVIERAGGKVLVATFGSHVQRVAACAEVCRRTGRKMQLVGRSLIDSVRAARDLGLLPVEDVLLGHARPGHGRGGRHRRGGANAVPDHKLLVVASGCQGERMGSVAQVARGEHRLISLGAGDTLIFSARVIPGNERAVGAMFDQLADRGVTVVDGREGRHVSGHGSRGDLEALLAATRPRAFAPIHGGGRQLAAHRQLATAAGIPSAAIFPIENGVSLTLQPHEITMQPGPALTERWIQGRHIVPDAQHVAEERRRMSSAGLLLLNREGDEVHVEGRALAPGLLGESARRFVGHRALELWDEPEPFRTRQLASKLRTRFGVAPEIWWH